MDALAGPLAELPVVLAHAEEDAVIVGVEGRALIVTLLLFVAEQLFAFVTVRPRLTLPEAPAVKVIDWMSVALVIVPPLMVQAYVVAPAGPLAVFPVVVAHTEDDAVIVGVVGAALSVTVLLLVAVHPFASETVKPSVTFPEDPAV